MKPNRKSQPEPAYRNPKLAVERRVKDLPSRMTLQEKVARMLCIWHQKINTMVGEKGRFDPQKARAHFKDRLGWARSGGPAMPAARSTSTVRSWA